MRAQAQGGKNSCWSCIIKILLSGAWQSPINPSKTPRRTLSQLRHPALRGTSSGLALCGESRRPGHGRPWAEPRWARMGIGEGECGQGFGPGLPLGPTLASLPPLPLSWRAQRPLQPFSPSARGHSTRLLTSRPPSPSLPGSQLCSGQLLPNLPTFSPQGCHPLVPPLLPSLPPALGNVPFPSPAQVQAPLPCSLP